MLKPFSDLKRNLRLWFSQTFLQLEAGRAQSSLGKSSSANGVAGARTVGVAGALWKTTKAKLRQDVVIQSQ